MSFMDSMKETINEGVYNESVTENGALGFRTTGKELLDINFAISSLRNETERQIGARYAKAFYENKLLALKWLFFAGDVRGGVGERRLFRICFKYLAINHSDIAKALLPLVAEYTRWDNMWCLLNTALKNDIVNMVKKQLEDDMTNMKDNKPISLLAKWMPSINTSSEETKRYARIFIDALGIKDREYRKMLSAMRKYLKVVEVDMSAKEWGNIDYAKVPSRANLIYNSAFLRNDETRRRSYLDALSKGETKINAGVLFPHDIVHKYTSGHQCILYKTVDIALEEMWKALPDYVKGQGNTICVADGSGSMTSRIGRTETTALDVANALAIYFAERSSGEFHDTYITFSERPQIVNLSTGRNLKEKLEIAFRYDECANTNIEKVFDLILDTAIHKKLPQEEIPTNILILSDMEFDGHVTAGEPEASMYGWGFRSGKQASKKDFELIQKKYEDAGYKLPRVIFWNINSRTGTIPLKENDMGVALVSGFSPAIMQMVLSNKLDPYEVLVEQLSTERYLPVEEAVKDLLD